MKFLLICVVFICLLHDQSIEGKSHQSDGKYDYRGKSESHESSDEDIPKEAIAKLSTGRVQGYVVSPSPQESNAVNVFKGVPFAAPPVGDLRYEFPKPAEEWKGTWNATYYRPACPSNTSRTMSPQKNVNEDCLYVNIFADQACQKKKCPVFYLVHGGSFYYDSATMFNDTFLIENYASRGLVVVIPAYRIGILGFADLGSDELIPRNLGLYDIVHALQWVQDEIEAFGGDPKQVTVFGNSAGGSVITYFSVAQNVKKLWSRAVIISPASPLWKNSNFNVTAAIIEKAGCANNGSYDLPHPPAVQVACLKKKNYTELLEIQRAVEETGVRFDGISTDSLMFDDKKFIDLLDDYKAVPTLFGTTLWEFTVDDYDTIPHYCEVYAHLLDYSSQAVINNCTEQYSDKIYEDNEHNPLSRDGMRAFMFRLASTVANAKKDTYIYSFELEGHDTHANELTFAIGLHPIEGEPSWKEALMLEYYPKVLRSFIKNENVENYLVPFKNGRNYEVFDFTNTSGTLRGPSPILQPYFPEALSYWLGDLGKIEKTVKAIEEKNRTDTLREKWAEIQEKEREERWQKYREARKRAEISANVSATKKQKAREAKEKQFLDYLLSNSLTEVANGLKKVIKVEQSAGVDASAAEAALEKVEKLIDGLEAAEEDEERKWVPGHWRNASSGHHYGRQGHHSGVFDDHKHQKDEKDRKDDNSDEESAESTEKDIPGIGRGDPSNPRHVSDIMKDIHDAQRKKDLQEASKNATAEAVKPKLDKINETKAQLDEDIKNAKETVKQSEQDQADKLKETQDQINQKKNETNKAIADDIRNAAEKVNATKVDRIAKANSTAEKINDAKADSAKDDKNAKSDIAKTVNETSTEIKKKLNATNNDINDKLDSAVDKVRNKRAIDEATYQKAAEIYNNTKKSVNDKLLEADKLKNETVVELSEKWNSTLTDLEAKRREAIQKWKEQVAEIDGDDKNGGKYSFQKEAIRANISAELKKTLKQIRSEARDAFEKEIEETEDNYSEAVQKLKNETREIVLKALQDFKQLKNETLESVRADVFASQTGLLSLPVLDNIWGSGVQPAHRMSEDAREAWSAFWIVATIAAMLAAALLMMSIMNWFKSHREPRGGYYYNDDPGFFTEKSRIVLASVPKYSEL